MEYVKHSIGNATTVNYLRNQVKNGTVSAANLWIGSAHLGKTTLAFNLAFALLCDHLVSDGTPCLNCKNCTLLLHNSHPNCFMINGELQSIGKAEIDELVQQLQQTSLLKGKRVVIIQAAEALTTEASSVLLKMLEEPPAQVYFILITGHSERILTTIQSRCAKLYFYGSTANTQAESMSDIAQQWLEILLQNSFTERLQLLQTYWPEPINRAQLHNHVTIVEQLLHQLLLLHYALPGKFEMNELMQKLTKKYALNQITQGLHYLSEIDTMLYTQVQPKILLNNILLNI